MIGRIEEQRTLLDRASREEAQFIVVYGRRRVGKTYLVHRTFEDDFFFSYTGAARVSTKKQLELFEKALRQHGWAGEGPLKDWFEAFSGLRELIAQAGKEAPKRIFIDEMPWMDNKKSNFVPAFEYFWNAWASGLHNLTLIVCGSATSWITKKVFKNRGGLYNRVTCRIHLRPFTLAECREFFHDRGIVMNPHDMVECYMVFGGIPYYLDMLDKKYSLPINIDHLCFAEGAPLQNEFAQLFETLYSKPERYEEVVRAISSKKTGLMREDIAHLIGFPDGGNLTRILGELEESGFIRRYHAFGKKKNGALYQLSDPFTGFHFDFLETVDSENYWSSLIDNARHRAWSGYAFEGVCLAHIRQIKKALGISGVLTCVSSWRSRKETEPGAQVDLVIDRNDNVINLCEMKYANNEFVISADYERVLRNKRESFRQETHTNTALHLSMVTTYGVKNNNYYGAFQSQVTMSDLFEL
jgi:AAA+ ATPase superfamily predicted ATPase